MITTLILAAALHAGPVVNPYPNTWGTATELRCMSAIATRFGYVKPTVLQQRILSTYVRMHGGTPCRAFLSSRRSAGRF